MLRMRRIAQIGYAVRIIASAGPRFGTFFINTGCNRRCEYCVVPQEGSGVELPVETWQQITARVTSWGVRFVSILGGEPTLRKDLPEIMGYISRKAAVSLTSNGDTFVGSEGRKRIRILSERGLSVLNVSLHDLDELDRQLEILRHAKSLGVIPILATVVTKATIAKLPDIMQETNKQGILYRYILMQGIGGSFSPLVEGGAYPAPSEIASFVALVQKQKKRMRLIANTSQYVEEGTEVYPKGWHCDSHTDHWVVVDNEGNLMACNEYRTQIPVLEIPSLLDPRWAEARTSQRERCVGCSYECHMAAEGATRLSLIGEAVDKAKSMLFTG